MSDAISEQDLNVIGESIGAMGNLSSGDVNAVATMWAKTFRGLGKSQLKKKYQTFNEMKPWGAMKLSRFAHALPIRSGKVLVKKRNDDVPDERVDFIRDAFVKTVYPRLIKNIALMAPFNGVAEFERVWKFVPGEQFGLSGELAIYHKLKFLQPDDVVIADDEFGDFAGLVVFPDTDYEVILEKVNSYIYTWDEEGSHNGKYGTSMNQEAIEWWDGYQAIIEQYCIYLSKSVGAAPTITYPEGQSRDMDGVEVDSSIIAIQLAETIHANLPTVVPSNAAALMHDILSNGQTINPSQMKGLQKWQIEMNESSGTAGPSFLEGLRYYDHQVMHQWLVLPRAVEEGQFGTKAESGEHKEFMERMAKISLDEVLQQISETLVGDLLEINFGPEARTDVYLEAEAIDPRVVALVSEIAKLVLGNPANLGEFHDLVDAPELMELAGIPKNSDEEIKASQIPNEERLRRQQEMLTRGNDAENPDMQQ